LEEAEWVGLKPWEAVKKLQQIEQKKFEETFEPLKFKFAEETLEQVETEKLDIDKRLAELEPDGYENKS
jgi:hypothetical protein